MAQWGKYSLRLCTTNGNPLRIQKSACHFTNPIRKRRQGYICPYKRAFANPSLFIRLSSLVNLSSSSKSNLRAILIDHSPCTLHLSFWLHCWLPSHLALQIQCQNLNGHCFELRMTKMWAQRRTSTSNQTPSMPSQALRAFSSCRLLSVWPRKP